MSTSVNGVGTVEGFQPGAKKPDAAPVTPSVTQAMVAYNNQNSFKIISNEIWFPFF